MAAAKTKQQTSVLFQSALMAASLSTFLLPAFCAPSTPAPSTPAPTAPAQTGMAGAGKWVPAELEFENQKCTVQVPGDYSLNEFVGKDGKLFCFKGPAHPNQKAAIFNVTIMPAARGADLPGERTMMDTMLNPHRHSLKEYKEEKAAPFTNGGHNFKGMSFSGKAADGAVQRGFVYLTQDKTTFFVLFGEDQEPFAAKALPLLLKSAQGCAIQKVAAAPAPKEPEAPKKAGAKTKTN